jgi:signal transduction histidine kinase
MRLQKLRQKISYDLHDDIGSNLSSIQVLTALSKNPNISAEKKTEIADKIKDSTAQVTQSLEEIIWNLHPNNDHFENIQNRLYEQANELLAPKGITLHFNMEADFENLKLGHEKRRELLLLYREALNNTIKYAECTDVWVEMRRQGRLLSLSIRDNGKGFDPAAATGGNGLVTMRYRAENLGGSFSIASEPGKGTVASLDFPAF